MRPLRTLLAPYFALFPLFAGIFAAPQAHAAASCVITPADIKAVVAAEAEGVAGELAARKALLLKTIVCAKADVQALKDRLNQLSLDGKTSVIRTNLLDKLNDAANFYDIESAKVDGVGLAGSRAIAREMLDWRASNYATIDDQVANFFLWVNDQAVLNAANDRLAQLKNVVAFLEQAGSQSDLEALLGAATPLIKNANDENAAARDALIQLLPPDQSFALIKQSLDSLSAAYKKFSDMSVIIQKLLPTVPAH